MKNPPRAIVLCAGMNGLGTVRSLGVGGVPTIAVALSEDEPVLRSRFGDKLVVSSHASDDKNLLTQLLCIGSHADVLIPTSDDFANFIERNRSRLERKFSCCIPSDRLVAVLIDKASETRCMEGLGIALPRTVRELPNDPKALISALGLPLIIKPRTSVISNRFGIKTRPIYDPAALHAWFHEYSSHLTHFIAQELIPGGDGTQWGCICVFDERHHPVSTFTFRKIRTAPSGFGVTCFARSEWNSEVAAIARQIGAGLGYVGPFDLDLKFDSRDGVYKYLESNPRLSMINYFGTTCGVNSAYAAYRIAAGQRREPEAGYQRDGAFFLDLFDDLYSRTHSGRTFAVAMLESLFGYLQLHSENVTWGYFAPDDFGPGLWKVWRDCWGILTSLVRRLMRFGAPSHKEQLESA